MSFRDKVNTEQTGVRLVNIFARQNSSRGRSNVIHLSLGCNDTQIDPKRGRADPSKNPLKTKDLSSGPMCWDDSVPARITVASLKF